MSINLSVDQYKYTNYCLCTLAFGDPYRLATKKLGEQAKKSDIQLIVATDFPEDFKEHSNIVAVKFNRTSILYPYNDKRFAVAAALQLYDCVVLVDADSEIVGSLPKQLYVKPGMTALCSVKSLENDLKFHHPQNFDAFHRLATKFKVNLHEAQWVCETLIVITKDQGKELKFIQYWEFADRWLGLRKVFQGDHGFIGLAAAATGWKVEQDEQWKKLQSLINHKGRESIGMNRRTIWDKKRKIERQFGFHWRRFKALISSLSSVKDYWLS